MEALRCQNDSLSAYPDYLTFLRQQREDFGWLYEFMRRNESLGGKTRMVVAESSKRDLKLKHYTDGTDIQEFLEGTMVMFLRTEEYRSGPFRVSCQSTTFPNFLSFSKPSKDPSPSSAAYYEALLRRISPEEIAAGNANPILYILPYARLLALRISGRIKGFRDDIRGQEKYAESVDEMSDLSDGLKGLNDGLNVSIASLRRHHSLSSAYRELLRDYEDLLNDAKQTTFDFKGILTREVSLLALKESKESIRQTQIVSRLSQLAFVFIPLTFVTSCFGMNLTVLGSGKGKTWVVCVIAAAWTIFVLLISLFSWRMAHYCSGVLERNTRPFRVLPRPAWYLPVEAMWTILFMISKPSKVSAYLSEMGLYYHLLPEGKDEYIDIKFYRPRIELSEFWKAKSERIHKFFHTHGWKKKKKSFLNRLRQK